MALSRRRAKLVGRLGHRKTREREGLVLVEGVRTAVEALDAGAEMRFALVSPRLGGTDEGRALAGRLEAGEMDVDHLSDAEMAEVADTETPQGVLLVCAEPGHRLDGVVRAGGRYLLLDAVQDPGNVGTLVRASSAFALDGVVALDGTVDPWSPKTVRASVGTCFRLPVVGVPCGDAVEALAAAELPLLVADAAGTTMAGGRDGGWALAVGNEGAGPRPRVRAAASAFLRIPIPGPVESLNAGVAGSILLYALTVEAGRVPTG